MKNMLYLLLTTSITISALAQQMVIKKTDGSNSKVDLNTIESINFIIPCPGTPIVDYGGKIYNTLLIGNQCWLKENLDIGTMIQNTQIPTNNSNIEKWCYENNPTNCSIYGGLYSWNEAMQYLTNSGSQGICPDGWHIPTVDDFSVLMTAVDNDGNSLKREDQGTGSGIGTNTSGYSALLAGYKDGSSSSGWFGSLGYECFIWSSNYYNSTDSFYLFVPYSSSQIYVFSGHYKSNGLSVRCIKDN